MAIASNLGVKIVGDDTAQGAKALEQAIQAALRELGDQTIVSIQPMSTARVLITYQKGN